MSASGRPILFRGARAVLRDGCSTRTISVLVAGGRIAAVGDSIEESGARVIDAGGRWLLPGLIDMQINDVEWLARGPADAAFHAARIREVIDHQVSLGVTGFVLATLASPPDELEAYLRGMALVRAGERALDAVFLGGLLEGTFMNPEHHGAHNPRWVMRPDRALLERLIATGGMRAVNIAPEMSAGAIDLIRLARERGVVVACGHARPHAERLREAVRAGLRYIIHLGNGPTGSSFKTLHDGGMLEEALRNDDLSITVIADGHHVHPRLIRDWIARKPFSRVVAVSDAGFALGPPVESFEVFGIRGGVAPGGAYLYLESSEDPDPARAHSSDAVQFFGSAVDQKKVFENILNLLTIEVEGVYQRRHEPLAFADAVCTAVAICSTNAARLLDLDDRGGIDEGARADLLLARIEGEPGAYGLEIDEILAGGRRMARG
ncbi:MAG: amidohydrolase family protein [Planctomycetes bacterium]|nr:amidohydrolase family protein [Planctomycetota bacterium]